MWEGEAALDAEAALPPTQPYKTRLLTWDELVERANGHVKDETVLSVTVASENSPVDLTSAADAPCTTSTDITAAVGTAAGAFTASASAGPSPVAPAPAAAECTTSTDTTMAVGTASGAFAASASAGPSPVATALAAAAATASPEYSSQKRRRGHDDELLPSTRVQMHGSLSGVESLFMGTVVSTDSYGRVVVQFDDGQRCPVRPAVLRRVQ